MIDYQLVLSWIIVFFSWFFGFGPLVFGNGGIKYLDSVKFTAGFTVVVVIMGVLMAAFWMSVTYIASH